VRSLVGTGVLAGEAGAYHLAQVMPSIQVPATVQALLGARIDRLPPEEKWLLQTSAVIGTEVPLTLLQAIAERPEEGLHRDLAHLQAAEFLYETRLFPDHEYTFKHALTHEVAYGSLLQERRRALHARIVKALEALAGDRASERVDRLAYHALRGEVWDKALVYCRQAGEKAITRSAHREAVAFFEQELRAIPHVPETHDIREQAIDLRLTLRVALYASRDSGRILACLREAEALAEALDDPHRLAQVSLFLSRHYMPARDGDPIHQAIAAAQRALALATASGEVVLQALANHYLALGYASQGNYRRAIDCYHQTEVSLEGARCHERFGQLFVPAVLSRADLAWCHAELGTFAEGRALGQEALRIADEVHHTGSLMFAYRGIGIFSLYQGNLHRALPQLERAVSLCQDADLPGYFPLIAAPLGTAYTLSGRIANAVPLLTQAVEQATATDMYGFQVLCGLALGEAQMRADRLGEAQMLTELALTLACGRKECGRQAYALRLLGEIAAQHDPPDAEGAGRYYRQALTLAEEFAMRPLIAHCHLGLGTLYAKIRRREQAHKELSVAIELYRAMEMTFWLPQAETALAQVEGR
jgi:tetratricopeptide (TPR) repeat protein